ncbi:hypothetical protein JCGZ_07361 [Jatropha curcas]|uniref:Senescence domain-containing protein n=1 Tax=Jatropha curcas TaxID=180498 RepID=A0A067KND8_JATCU|nr:hypothetical protein JCGZ_07361 [Jatropha curcas]
MAYFRRGKPELTFSSKQKSPKTKNINREVLLQIPGCIVYLMDKGGVLDLAKGDFELVQILDKGVCIANIIKVGNDLQWPLTKDEPVVKLDSVHYLFSLPMKDSDPLSYGVTFSGQFSSSLPSLDAFLMENSCFSSTTSTKSRNIIEWNQFSSRIEDYKNVLANAIVEGTGQIVKGIFIMSNTYSSQVHNGGEIISNPAIPVSRTNSKKYAEATNESSINESIKRVRSLSQMTEKLSKAVLDQVGVATGSVMSPLVTSQAGKAFLATAPGEILLASLDAVNKILDAAEIAGKQALSATSAATTRMVTDKYGEGAGEATKEVLATAGHCANTAWNILKIRKAINPASSVSTGIIRRNSGKYK